MRKTLIPFLLLSLVVLTGCVTVGEKKIPRPDIDSHTAGVFVETNQKLYNGNAYLSSSEVVKTDPLFDETLIIDNKTIALHRTTTQKLLKGIDFLNSYANQPIKGTGVNLFGFGLSTSVIIIIILCILFPSVASFMWLVIRRLRRGLKTLVDTIEQSDEYDTTQDIKKKLSAKMDTTDKQLIAKIKHTP
jgi:Sec-independent protein translocase protein TatA